ncbi:efflux RND transporter permease subunit [Silanimonas sp.]|uniref:efflux RND transporter permease subunit n=1 Tax=Silanimonas sp. TaxID=1929290 RepID=UPI0022C4BA00|nr:efflux RND transporter permease subunit [Silanimonas sp.]MCZ8063590.1 efflux RND transporter permease subunit [Silanimonas sp.]
MSITATALKRARFTLAAAAGLMIAGVVSLFGFPATEEPTVPTRIATVEAYFPGASSARVEQLVARPIEERVREIAEVKTIDTVVRPGATYIYVSLHPETSPDRLPSVWQRLRAKASDAAEVLPEGTIGPIVNDEFGRVSVLTLALTGQGYSAGQLQDWARKVRGRLQSLPGVEQISLHGVREERVYVELSPAQLAAHGLSIEAVATTLANRNVIAPSGELDAGGRVLALEPSGDLPDTAALATVQIPLPDGGVIALAALGEIRQQAQDPPLFAAIYDGKPAVVLGASMRAGLNVNQFVATLREAATAMQADLPAGMRLDTVTDQSEVVAGDLTKVGQIFIETIVIVMLVVVVFLGWRAGMVTGLIVPLTVLGTLVFMRVAGIELHTVSIGAIIISLGLFVDNAIVVVEDYQRRLGEGDEPDAAARAAGETMAGPLLVSSLAIIFAFAPLVAGASETAEYMRSLAIVLAVTLLLSLFLALTFTAVTARMFVGKADPGHEDHGPIARVRDWYVVKVRSILRYPAAVATAMFVLLGAAIVASELLPTELLSPSARKQLQIPVELPPGASSRETLALAQRLSARLADRAVHPQLRGNVVYVGDGGPRFILGLNPPTPAAHRAYAVVNLDDDADLDATVEHLRGDLSGEFPGARIEPKRFSLGVSEAGTAVFRLAGPDRAALQQASARLREALGAVPGMLDVKDDAEGRIVRLALEVDPIRANAAGVTTADISRSLDAAYGGALATALRQDDILVPVLLRAPAGERHAPERLQAMPVVGAAGAVPLGQIARVQIADQPSVLIRRNQSPVITVSARHPEMTAQAIVDAMGPVIAGLGLPAAHSLQLGGEIEEGVEANAGLVTYFPLAILGMAALFLWQFGSLRKTFIILASMPFVLIGATLGLAVTAQPMSYTATLGLLALAGIIVNNAVLLLERIVEEQAAGKPQAEAIAAAAAVRLRPIVMTKLTCVVGLLPLFVFGGDLWRPMAAAMIGGLALGTLITLVLIPALYALLFRGRATAPANSNAPLLDSHP